jgi:uncharacterized protein
MKVVFDNNIWLSYAIGNHMEDIPKILLLPTIELFACSELLDEFERVRHYPKLQKYLKPERAKDTIDLICAKALFVPIIDRNAEFVDPKDNYLLDLCRTVSADVLVTGDKALLALEVYEETRILTYRSFCDRLNLV